MCQAKGRAIGSRGADDIAIGDRGSLWPRRHGPKAVEHGFAGSLWIKIPKNGQLNWPRGQNAVPKISETLRREGIYLAFVRRCPAFIAIA